MSIIIEISLSGETSACLENGLEIASNAQILEYMRDCTKSGDCQPACEYVRDHIGVDFRIVAKNANGDYENRLATNDELKQCCDNIYFESDIDFSHSDTAKTYLIWDIAHNLID